MATTQRIIAVNFDASSLANVKPAVYTSMMGALKPNVEYKLDDDRTGVTAIWEKDTCSPQQLFLNYADMLAKQVNRTPLNLLQKTLPHMLALGIFPLFAAPYYLDSWSSKFITFCHQNNLQYWKKPRFTLFDRHPHQGSDIWVPRAALGEILGREPAKLRMTNVLPEVFSRCPGL